MHMTKKFLIVPAAAALMLSSAVFGTASAGAASPEMIGMPSPLVSYNTIAEAKKVAGFTPLYLPEISGYHVSDITVIGGNLIDLTYAGDGQNAAANLSVRTAKADSDIHDDDISGIYSVNWEKQSIDGLTVYVAEVPATEGMPSAYAAHWKKGGMLFSVFARNITAPEFSHLLKAGLVDLSAQYF